VDNKVNGLRSNVIDLNVTTQVFFAHLKLKLMVGKKKTWVATFDLLSTENGFCSFELF